MKINLNSVFKGGDGSVGIKGVSALFSDVIDSKNQLMKKMILEKSIYTHKLVNFYFLEGKQGGKGEDGALAGCGGLGGLFGDIMIIKNRKWFSTNSSAKYGQNGDLGSFGLGGLGGFYGDTDVRGKLRYSSVDLKVSPHKYIDSNSFVNSYNSYKLSDKRGPNGLMRNELNCLDRKPPTVSLDYASINRGKRDYMKFINDINSEFQNSFLTDSSFSKSISN